jgi:hypothetical protein
LAMAKQHYLLGDRAPSRTCVSWCCSYDRVGRFCLSRGRRRTANASTRVILAVCPLWRFRDLGAINPKKKSLTKMFAHDICCLEKRGVSVGKTA